MNDIETIKAINQDAILVKLSAGDYTVNPLTVRRCSSLVVLLKEVQGDLAKLSDIGSPDFQQAATNALMAAGENMPRALALFAGNEELGKLEDISLLDLSAVVLAGAKVNKASSLFSSFRQAMETYNGKADQK